LIDYLYAAFAYYLTGIIIISTQQNNDDNRPASGEISRKAGFILLIKKFRHFSVFFCLFC